MTIHVLRVQRALHVDQSISVQTRLRTEIIVRRSVATDAHVICVRQTG